ncbi:MAG: four helix bundle protein [Desulfobulbaceae bacterium]|uniref:Four helix bundle protein n=1 Tax=Candidatus Desulfobia pelagia TaxID=2841692 RepID=A0A8J6ND50_9BACT|nr:four helix bundle protein [Candidatus Desulfobia pelagia]
MKFEDLDVWKRSSRLCAELYKYFRETKDFGFRDQITRSALSIPSNIAEGVERDSQKEFARFLQYAKGSCGELRTQLYIGVEIEYIKPETGKTWVQETREISAMLVGLLKSVKLNTEN